MSWEPIIERLIVARIKTKIMKLFIIMCYAPTEATSREEKDTFYFQLQSVLNGDPNADMIVLMGDMNA